MYIYITILIDFYEHISFPKTYFLGMAGKC